MELVAAGASDSPGVDQAEVLFLLVQALHGGPFASLGAALAEQASAQGLLPRRHDVHGAQHALSFEELQQRYANMPPNALAQLLSQLLERRRMEAPQPTARGLTSLLEAGPLGMLSSGNGNGSGGGGGGSSNGGAAAGVSMRIAGPPVWMRPGRLLPSEAHRLLLLRQAGLLRSAQHPGTVQPAESYARQLSHALTVRGHRYAVYCVAYDRTGRYLITGSDDRLVKVWSTRTGLLQASCRGHDAEITDLSVSADNSLVASSSMDGTVRVWQLEGKEGRPGLPVSVLVGHGGAAAFLDFHPTHPDALLSASFDGTLRIWRARDASAPPIVLQVDTARFGLRGHAVTRLGGLGWPGLAGSAGVAAANGGPDLGSGMRTTRGMERQLLGLQGSGAAGAAGSQQEQAGPRASGRAARQHRSMNELVDDEGEADGEHGGAAAADGDGAQEEGDTAAATGLLVCGFSKDGTHIVAGGNDCSVYVWQWELPQPAAQQLGLAASTPGNTPAGPAAQGAAGAAGAASVPAVDPLSGQQQRQQQAVSGAGVAEAVTAGAGAAPQQGLPVQPAVEGAARAEMPDGSTDQAGSAGPASGDERSQQVQQLAATAAQQVEQQRRRRQRRAGGAGVASMAGEDAPWPAPREVCQLKGHRNDVILLQFSHGGDRVATGSKDGSVRVWRRPKRWRKRLQAWEQEVTFAVLPDPEAIKEARRRRRPPPAPSVDQIAWSADDQRLCVSITDFGIRVLAMPSGQLLHNLSIHTNHVHILECHPTDPDLAFSSSYDGTLVIWDTRSGAVLRRFSSRQTRPDGRSWPDVIPLSDGHFSPDGRSITVTDVAGQFHSYALGPPCSLLSRAPYDQFLTTDYNPLLRDQQHNVLDAETQLPPHILTGRDALCDALGNPYPEPLQAAYRAQCVLSAPLQEVTWLEPGKEPGYLLAAPTLTAAVWSVEQVNGTEHAVQLAIARAQERLTVHEDRLDAGATAAAARAAAEEAVQPRSRQRGAAAAWAAIGEEAAGADEVLEPASSGEMYTDSRGRVDSDEDVDSTLLTSEEEDDDDEEEEDGQGGSGRGRRGRGRRGGSAAEPSRHSSRLAGRRHTSGRARGADGGGGGAGLSRPSTRRSRPAAAAAVVARGSEDDHEQREEQQRADREARVARRRAAQQERLAEERHRRQRQAAANRRRQQPEDSSEDEEISAASSDSEAGPSQRPTAQQRGGTSRRRGRAEMEGGAEAAAPGSAQQEEAGRQRKRQRRSHGGWREFKNYSWLSGSEQTPGIYVPQAGDSVVYLREGHERFLASTNDKRPPPWQMLRNGRSMRPAEPCSVVDVHYVIANDGTDHTQAQLTLKLSDEASQLKDTCFTVEVPPPMAGHAEFVVHHSRFEASVVSKCWEVGDQCQSYWIDDDNDEGAGIWWVGTIVADQRNGRNADVLADPFSAGEQWDRFEVQWQGVVGPDGELTDKQAPNSFHCPWELYTPGTTSQAALQEAPMMEAALTQRMLAAVEAASQQERFLIFVDAPAQDEMYLSRTRRSQYYNRLVALPLSLSQLSSRLRRGYYRQPEALASDISTIASNAVEFNGEENAIAEDAAALAQYLTAVLQGQEPDLAAYAAYPEDAAAEAAAAAAGGGSSRRPRRRQKQRQHLGADDLDESEGEDVGAEQGQPGEQFVLPPLPPGAEFPPMPPPELSLAADHHHQQQQQQYEQQQQQQQQYEQQQQPVQPWLSGLPSSSARPSPTGPAGVAAGFAGTGAGRPGGGLRVRLTLRREHRSEAATEGAAAAAAAAGDGLFPVAAWEAGAAAAPAATSPGGAEEGGTTGTADGATAAAVSGLPALPASAQEAGEPAAAVGQTAAAAAVPTALQTALAAAAADLAAGSGETGAAVQAAATAAGPAAAAFDTAWVAGPAAALEPPSGAPLAWFGGQAGGWPNGSAVASQQPALAQGAEAARQSMAGGSRGRYGLRASGAGSRRTYGEYADQEEEQEEEYAPEASSSDSEGGERSGRRPRQRGAAAARQQQSGRRTSRRARQHLSYRESEGEEEDEQEVADAAWQQAWAQPAPRQQQQQRPSRQRHSRQKQQQKESDEDWEMAEEEEEEEEEEAGGSGGGGGGGDSSDSGGFGSLRRRSKPEKRSGRRR